MAHIRSGSIVSDIRGKVGTEIYSRNKHGAYVKAYAAPTNPNSPDQQANRTDFQVAVSIWQSLADSERMRWNAYAASLVRSNSIGDKRLTSGYNLFLSRQINGLRIGLGVNPDPYISQQSAVYIGEDPVLTESSLIIDRATEEFGNSWWMFVAASPPVSPGVMSPNSTPIHLINQFAAIPSGTTDQIIPYTNKYGSLAGLAGMKIFWKITLVNRSTFVNGNIHFPLNKVEPDYYMSGIIQS